MAKVDVKKNILAKNQKNAEALRESFDNCLVLNFVSSPGSGKTSILEKILPGLADKYKVAVIEGDLQTENDAERIRKTGVQAVQVQTGGACHLDAEDVSEAVKTLPEDLDILIIENVGNLVCPSSFDLGEDMKVVVLSVTEGDDKPAKYPSMFRASSAFIINKTDLLPHVDFDVDASFKYAREVKGDLDMFRCSYKTGEGLEKVSAWIAGKAMAKLGK